MLLPDKSFLTTVIWGNTDDGLFGEIHDSGGAPSFEAQSIARAFSQRIP
jgi:hypothetical protein